MNNYTPQRDLDFTEGGGVQEKRKPNRPHYKELFEDLKRSHDILFRCVIGISIIAAASLALNVLLITQLKP